MAHTEHEQPIISKSIALAGMGILCYLDRKYCREKYMSNLRILIVVVVIILVGYFTWDTITQLKADTSIERGTQGSYAQQYFGNGYSRAELIRLKKDTSDSILMRGIFLDAVVLLTGTFAYLATGKLQSRKNES